MLGRRGLAGYVELFRGAHLASATSGTAWPRWWDLDALHARYAEFLDRQEPCGSGSRRGGAAPERAFADYVRLLTDWRRLPYADPGSAAGPAARRLERRAGRGPVRRAARPAGRPRRTSTPAASSTPDRRSFGAAAGRGAGSGEGGDALDLDQRLGVPEPGDADPGHRRVVGADQPAPDAADLAGVGAVVLEVDGVDGQRGQVLGLARRPRAGRSAGCRAPARTARRRRRRRSGPRASSAVCPARKTIRVGRGEHRVREAGRAGQLRRVDPLETAHDWTAPPSTLMPCPVIAALCTHSSTASATSSGSISRPIGWRRASASRASASDRPVVALIVATVRVGHRGVDVAGADGVHRDARRRDLRRRRPDQAEQAVLARRVRADVGVAPLGGDRGDGDDPAPALLDHARQRPAQQPERRGEVEVEHALPSPRRWCGASGAEVAGAGVEHEHLDRAAHSCSTRRDHRVRGGGIGEVGGDTSEGPGSSAASASSSSALRAVSATGWPSADSRWATAAPMPRPAPVTRQRRAGTRGACHSPLTPVNVATYS